MQRAPILFTKVIYLSLDCHVQCKAMSESDDGCREAPAEVAEASKKKNVEIV